MNFGSATPAASATASWIWFQFSTSSEVSMKRVADGGLMPEQAEQRPRKIRVVGKGPERGAVSRDNHRHAPTQPINRGIGHRPTIHRQRNHGLAIGERRADNGHRERLFAQRRYQQFFAGILCASIFPEWDWPGAWTPSPGNP